MSSKKLKIISIVNSSMEQKWREISLKWEKFFNIEHIIKVEKKIENIWKEKPDFLFVSEQIAKQFEYHFYSEFKKMNRHFKYLVITNHLNQKKDVHLFRGLVDDVVSLKMDDEWVYWKTIAI